MGADSNSSPPVSPLENPESMSRHREGKPEPPARRKGGHSSIAKGWAWLVTDSWAFEFAGLTIAIVALGSIGGMLSVYNGRPLSEWPYQINMNTVLSVLATVLKGSMLLPVCSGLSQLKWSWYHPRGRRLADFDVFDAASRGPLGAVILLYRLRFWHLASIGSIVTLLTLASDAFIQQSLRFPESVVNGTASIPIAQFYNKTARSAVDGGNEVHQSFVPALYNGILESNLSQSSSAMSPWCPTGNCTFPHYASLAMCSACTEVTPLLNSSDLGGDARLGGTLLTSLPNGLQSWDIDSGFTAVNLSSNTDLNTDDLLSFQPRLLNVSAIFGYYQTTPISHRAFDCVFYYCVKTYSGSVEQTQFRETVEDVYHDPDLGEAIDTGGQSAFMNMSIPQDRLPSGSFPTFGVGKGSLELWQYMFQQLTGSEGITVTGMPTYDNAVVHGIFF